MSAFEERVAQFGDDGRLVGILTLPSAMEPRLVLGLVNSGFIPRSGPFRVYTQLARRLAEAGVATLRFDLGGLGDSAVGTEGDLRSRTQADLRAAVDTIKTALPGVPVALGGICSGAEDAFRYAETDERVSRTLLMDPFAYRTDGWWWRHTRHRLYRRTLRAAGLWRRARADADSDLINYAYMPREESARILSALLARGTWSHFIYTGGRSETFNHVGQFAKMFPDLDVARGTTVDHLPGIDHTQMLQEDRDLLMAAITRRLREPLPSRAPGPR